MSKPQQPSYTIIRLCPEHLCKVFARERLLERAEAGEFRLRIDGSSISPFKDYKGQMCITSEEILICDDAYPVGHKRHEVVRAHRFLTDQGIVGASGLVDPKDIMIGTLIGDINYRKFTNKTPHCQLCERGDMIAPSERFHKAAYKPEWPLAKRFWMWLFWLPFRIMIRL